MNGLQSKTSANRRLATKWVQWLIAHSASYQLLCWFDSLVPRTYEVFSMKCCAKSGELPQIVSNFLGAVQRHLRSVRKEHFGERGSVRLVQMQY